MLKTIITRHRKGVITIGIASAQGVDFKQKLRAYPSKKKAPPKLEFEKQFSNQAEADQYSNFLFETVIKAI